ncbi:hypothetical protein D1007_23723 [Hordeum vulgare]|nr:hypothetical protein D1007_23723 [Hordeum vulgare]
MRPSSHTAACHLATDAGKEIANKVGFVYQLNISPKVLNEFTHGKQDSVSKPEFQHVLSDILLGMAAELKRDPIMILRVDGRRR